MAQYTETPPPSSTQEQSVLWRKALIIGLTLLVWLTVSGMILWGLSKVGSALTLLLVSMLVAYTIHPLVRLLQRFLPRVAAVALVYIGILGGILVLLYFIVFTAMVQLVQIAQQLQRNLPRLLNDLKPFLERIGLSASSLQMSSQWLTNQLLVVVGSIQPLLFNIFAVVLSSILVITLSVYFVLDGQRATHWLREHSPISVRPHVTFFLDTIDHTMGGFIRGQLFLGVLISAIQTIGLLIIGVPYLFFLAVIIFIGEFIPQIGAYISAPIILIIAFLARGWQVGLIAAIFCTIVNAGLEGQILAPRIIGHSVGLHPIISIAALLIATQLFGLIGAFLAAPAMGMIQIVVLVVWHSWKQRHPEQFPEERLSSSVQGEKGQAQQTNA